MDHNYIGYVNRPIIRTIVRPTLIQPARKFNNDQPKITTNNKLINIDRLSQRPLVQPRGSGTIVSQRGRGRPSLIPASTQSRISNVPNETELRIVKIVKATEHNQLKSKKEILTPLPIPPDQPVTSGAPVRSTINPAETYKLPDAESRSKDKVDKCVKLFQSIINIVETFIKSGNNTEMVRNLIKDVILNQICPKTFVLELEKIGINLPIIEPILNENLLSLKKAIDEREINMNWLETIAIEKARETTIDKQRTIDNIQERYTTSSSTVEEQYDRIFTETPVYRSIHEIYPIDELIHLKYIYEEEKKKNDLIEKKFLKDITDIPKSLEYYRTKCDEEEQKTLEINLYLKTLEIPQEVKIEENETQNNSFNYENLIEEMIFWKNKYEEKVISNQELERKFLKEVTFIPMLISYYTKNCEREEYRKSVLFDDNEAMGVLNEKDSSSHSSQKRTHSEISLEENGNKFIRLD